MSFTKTKHANYILFSATEDIYSVEALLLSKLINENKNEECQKIIFDFSQVTVVASSGISALINGHLELQKMKKELILVACQTSVINVFNLLGLHNILKMAATLEEATGD